MRFGWWVRFDPATGAVRTDIARDATTAVDATSGSTVLAAGGADAAAVLQTYAREPALGSPSGSASVAIHDAQRGTLVAARDRTGLYPLFSTKDGHELVVANDLRSLLAASPQLASPSRIALAAWLIGAPLAPEETLLSGVQRVPAGHVLDIDVRGASLRSTWQPPAPGTFGKARAAEFGERLEAAVRRAADGRRAAVYLSGGIDSSAVTAAAAAVARDEQGEPPLALCVDVEGASEAEIQALVCGRLGLRRTARGLVASRELLERGLERAASSLWPTTAVWMPVFDELAEAARADGIDVVLDGQGGDDLLDTGVPGGVELIGRPLDFVRWLRAESRYVGGVLPSVKAVGRSLRGRRTVGLPDWLSHDPGLRRELLDRLEARPASYAEIRAADHVHPVLSAQREETLDHAAASGLRHAHPLWDDGVVELLQGLAPAALVRHGQPKSPAREYLGGLVGELRGSWPQPALADVPVTKFAHETGISAWSALSGPRELVDLGVLRADIAPNQLAPLEILVIVSVEGWIRRLRGEKAPT